MLQSKIALIAQSVVRDAQTNQISIFNVIEGIIAQNFPLYMQNVSFFILWEREDGDQQDYHGTVEITLNGHLLLEHGIDLNFGQSVHNRTIFNLNGFLIPEIGKLKFVLKIDEISKASFELQVKTTQPPAERIDHVDGTTL